MIISDVEITYKLVPDEASLKAVAGKLTTHLNKGFSGIGSGGKNNPVDKYFKSVDFTEKMLAKGKSVLAKKELQFQMKQSEDIEKAIKASEDANANLMDFFYDLAKIFGKGRTINTKMSAVQDLFKSKLFGDSAKFDIGSGKVNENGSKNVSMMTSLPTEGAAGAGGQASMGAIAGALGGILSAVGIMAVGVMLISAFFEAVGPFIKVVMKLFAAFFLIALLPALKVLMKSLPLIWNVLKVVAQGIAFVLQAIIDVFGKAIGGMLDANGNVDLSKIDWAKILLFIFAPVPMLLSTIFGPMIITAGQQLLDWLKTSLPAFVDSAAAVITSFIDMIGTAVFGEDVWASIKAFINTLATVIFSKDGLWKNISDAITWIATTLFDTASGNWKSIQTAIQWLIDNIFGPLVWAPIQTALSDIVSALQSAADAISHLNFGSGVGAGGGLTLNPMSWGAELGKQLGFGNDFVSRPGGIVNFSPDDTIIGVKDPSKLGGKGGTTINNYYTISGNVDKAQLKQMMNDMAREQGRQLRGKTSYVSGFLA